MNERQKREIWKALQRWKKLQKALTQFSLAGCHLCAKHRACRNCPANGTEVCGIADQLSNRAINLETDIEYFIAIVQEKIGGEQ